MNGATTWITARRAITPPAPRRAPTRPVRQASGASTSAASAVRTNTIIGGENTSSSATLMNRYDAPQNAATKANSMPRSAAHAAEHATRAASLPITTSWGYHQCS